MHIRESFAEAEACHHGGRIRAEAAKRSLAQEDLLDYSANINPLGHPPLEDLILREMKKIGHYPDNDYVAYRRSCARFVGVDPENVVPGNGSSELMRLFAEALIEEGERVLIPTPTFGEYEAQSRLFGAEVVHVPQGSESQKVRRIFWTMPSSGGRRRPSSATPTTPRGSSSPGPRSQNWRRGARGLRPSSSSTRHSSNSQTPTRAWRPWRRRWSISS